MWRKIVWERERGFSDGLEWGSVSCTHIGELCVVVTLFKISLLYRRHIDVSFLFHVVILYFPRSFDRIQIQGELGLLCVVCVHSCCLTRHSTVEQRRITQKRVTMDEGRDREKWLSSSNTQKPWAEICWFMIKKRLKEPNKEKNELVKVMPVSSWYKLKRHCGIYIFFWCRDLPASISKVIPHSIHNQNRKVDEGNNHLQTNKSEIVAHRLVCSTYCRILINFTVILLWQQFQTRASRYYSKNTAEIFSQIGSYRGLSKLSEFGRICTIVYLAYILY